MSASARQQRPSAGTTSAVAPTHPTRDRHAPRFHFVAPETRCRPFDPNGCIHWRGRYHLFYIFQNPDLPDGGHCWGHASSVDLIDWTVHPAALAPAEGEPETGIFSGCALLDKDGTPTLVYYGVGAGICVATPTDDNLIGWRKHPANPVIAEPRRGEPAFDVYRVFDPHVWLENGRYHAILGGWLKPHGLHDTAFLFTSDDLVRWRYERTFYQPHPHWTEEAEDCACPDFFRLGDAYVLLCISHTHGARCYIGDFHEGTFIPRRHQRMNWPGGACFAPETLLDATGRRMMFAWAVEQTADDPGFATMTMPRVLRLNDAARLNVEPARELEVLRRRSRRVDATRLHDTAKVLLELTGDALELAVEIQPDSARRAGIDVLCSPNGLEQTRIVYDAGTGTLSIDTTRGSTSGQAFRAFPIFSRTSKSRDVPVQSAPLPLFPEDPVRLRIFIDRSIIEVFANESLCLTQRVYPLLASSIHTRIFAEGGAAEFTRIEAWDMAPLQLSSEA